MAVPPETVLTQLGWRYATKKFDPAKKIAPDLWAQLERAASLAPSSLGMQPWKFVVVTDPAVRQELHPVSYKQAQILDASHLVVFAAKKPPTAADADAHIARAAAVRGVPAESLDGYKKMMLGALSGMDAKQAHQWAARQCYIALGVFLATAALVGVDACPMEGFQADRYDEILGLKEKGLGAVVIAAAGYRSPEDQYAQAAKVRFTVDDIVIRA